MTPAFPTRRSSGLLAGGGKSGEVRFTLPPDTELTLPAGTMFPTEHTIRLLALARAGANWLHVPVYDGSSADSYIEIGSFIGGELPPEARSEEHTSELQSLMRISYAVFCLNK